MYEVELKVPAAHESLRERLLAAGATHVGTVTQVDTYYDHPGRSFADTDEALRVRRERGDESGEHAYLTYKGPLVESASKTREEVETAVEEADALDSILAAIDFEPAVEVRKVRERYELSDFTVSLDDVSGVGEFVEIERAGSEAEIASIRDAAIAQLRDLGLDPDDQIRRSYLELVLEAREK